MLKIFLSSTYRDLSDYREKILEEVDNVLRGIGMEKFVPDGTNSQEKCIKELKKSQIVVFLISPYYGSLIEKCTIMDACKADCPMKTGEGKISYTHCEYKTTLAEEIPHMAYLITEGWKEILDLKDVSENEINLSELKKIPFFEEMNDDLIENYIKIRKEASIFHEELGEEYRKEIETLREPENVQMIKDNLADNILEWYSAGSIEFKDFVDRRDELNNIDQTFESGAAQKVEVYGVGGIGKTSLIQIALLIQRLRGKKIVIIGTKQTYTGDSGYHYATEKLENTHLGVSIGNVISLDDVLNALSALLPAIKTLNKDIEKISNLIKTENVLLFIDDAHLVEDNVKVLIKNTTSLVLSSRERTGLVKKVIALIGIAKEDREKLINLLKPKHLEIKPKTIEDINKIAEGHPIFTNLLVQNFQEINLKKLAKDKPKELKKANQEEVDEFLKRVINEILSGKENTFELLKELSVFNIELENDIHIDWVKKAYNVVDVEECFNTLVKCGLLKKKIGENKIYEFYFKHIQLTLAIDTDQRSHEKAVQYYKAKKEKIGKSIEDNVEVLYHKFKSNPNEDIVYKFVKLEKTISPSNNSFKRLIDVGKQIKDSFQPDDIFRNEHKAKIIITLGHLYNKLERFQRAENLYKDALDYIGDIDKLIVENLNLLLSIDNNSFLDLFDKFIGNYMVYVTRNETIEISPWKTINTRLSKIIEDPSNDEIRDKIRIIFSFFNNMIGYKPNKLYFSEANELVQILVAEEPSVNEISNACALYDQLRWMANTCKDNDKELCLKTAELYEKYASVFNEVKRIKSPREAKKMRPYDKILESVGWHYHLGEEYSKSAENYIEIYRLLHDKLSTGMKKFQLWMGALNFSLGDEIEQSTEHYINLAKLLEDTQQISELAVELYQKAISQLDESSDEYSEIKERYQVAKEKFDTQKKSCEESEINALLVSNIYDKIAADITASHLYLNNINCYYDINTRSKDKLLENDGEYDYIILHGGSMAPGTGQLVVEIFGNEKDFAKLFQTRYSYKNVWILDSKDMKSRWILLAGNGAETTLESVDMFKEGKYLKDEALISL